VAKVTTKLQVTVPKALAEQFGLRPGSEITWEGSHDAIRIVPGTGPERHLAVTARLESFDEATERRRLRQSGLAAAEGTSRGWTREDLYDRGRAR